ncbi:hypothetical protein Dda_4459 [Drechslerella dactyloides]|uniref:Uncharacterized protein n=1 Tax=Drechslerella dactyloides TaxID=74499 RepID=A0AAD6IZ62_DREDA|nr:hypothetical protein Dda_4459 [Drechslerella dactyloides]
MRQERIGQSIEKVEAADVAHAVASLAKHPEIHLHKSLEKIWRPAPFLILMSIFWLLYTHRFDASFSLGHSERARFSFAFNMTTQTETNAQNLNKASASHIYEIQRIIEQSAQQAAAQQEASAQQAAWQRSVPKTVSTMNKFPRTSFFLGSPAVLCYPRGGGTWLATDVTPVELEFLGLDRLKPQNRSPDQDEEDKFCERLQLLDPDYLFDYSIDWTEYARQITDGVVAGYKFDDSYDMGIKNAYTMEERCQAFERAGAKFCAKFEDCKETKRFIGEQIWLEDHDIQSGENSTQPLAEMYTFSKGRPPVLDNDALLRRYFENNYHAVDAPDGLDDEPPM